MSRQFKPVSGSAGPRVRCLKCRDVIQSTHRHHMLRCRCGAIFVDGGGDYLRMGYSGEPEDAYEIVEEPSK